MNLSIDSRDPDPDYVSEDLSINDIETLTEFLAEVVFGLEDAFKEHEEHDNEGKETGDFSKVYFSRTCETICPKRPERKPSNFLTANSAAATGPYKDIHSPPPRA